jgi:pilus assembly protein TadC
MDLRSVVAIVLLVIAMIIVIGIIYFLTTSKNRNIQTLMRTRDDSIGGKTIDPEMERIKEETRKKNRPQREGISVDDKLFRAGIFGQKERADFYRFRAIGPLVCGPVLGALFWFYAGPALGLAGGILGAAVGYQAPISWIDRRIKARGEEIMFYLPLVIEQISIGVSSSLDVGPCLQKVVQMADERDTHNVVTELLKYAQNYIKSGVPFEEAMVETGKASGHTELKHAFMYLAQVAKHGGEITRQLQELAESVNGQRQAYIEGKIKSLELVATGPVTLVFLGFMIILMVGFGLKLATAF